MSIEIEQKIVGYKIEKPATDDEATVIHMHEKVDRPEVLEGATYKIKTPLSDHALYITINDIVLNPGTDHELRRPFEIFINSKNMDHFQWVVALTRVISAVFRKGGDVTFLVEELKAVFDPQGGYFAIESHLRSIGLLKDEGLSEHAQQILAEKRAQYEQQTGSKGDAFPESATLCGKCHTKAVILMDGCLTCLNCGESKCG